MEYSTLTGCPGHEEVIAADNSCACDAQVMSMLSREVATTTGMGMTQT